MYQGDYPTLKVSHSFSPSLKVWFTGDGSVPPGSLSDVPLSRLQVLLVSYRPPLNIMDGEFSVSGFPRDVGTFALWFPFFGLYFAVGDILR